MWDRTAGDGGAGGGSDANALIAQGFESVLLANGTEANHTASESVGLARITEMFAVCQAIAELASENQERRTPKLRRGVVVSEDPLTVEVGGGAVARRVDEALMARCAWATR